MFDLCYLRYVSVTLLFKDDNKDTIKKPFCILKRADDYVDSITFAGGPISESERIEMLKTLGAYKPRTRTKAKDKEETVEQDKQSAKKDTAKRGKPQQKTSGYFNFFGIFTN